MANSFQYSTGGEPSVRGKYVRPLPPTTVTATDVGLGRAFNNGAAYVGFIPNKTGAGTATSYTVTSSPGGFTAGGSSSPILVTGLQSATAYTFTVTATNSFGTSAASTASGSITATTVPQAPNAPTATAGVLSASLAIVATATGGKAISSYNVYSSSGRSGRGLSPVVIGAETAGVSRTYNAEAVNANGVSIGSPNSFAVTPTAAPIGLATVTSTTGAPSIDTTTRPGKTIYRFTGSGSITIGTAGTCEILCIGGGASGWGDGGSVSYGGGGGGAGGYVYNASALVAAATFTVTVGAGGGGIGNPSTVSNSSNSIVFANPGGSNAGPQSGIVLFGGAGASSAGRGGGGISSAWAVTTIPFVQGFAGGASTAGGSSNGGGGGGGSSAVGANSTSATGAAGGAGTANSITGVSVTRGGGGGGGGGGSNIGGAGGSGGGGNGGTGNVSAGSAGTANTGGGGGGAGATFAGGNGGSGVVIVVVG